MEVMMMMVTMIYLHLLLIILLSWVVVWQWKLLKGGISPEMRPAPNDQQPKLVTSPRGDDDQYHESDTDENNGRNLKKKKACRPWPSYGSKVK